MNRIVPILLIVAMLLPVKAQAMEEPVTLVYHGQLLRTRVGEESLAQLLDRLDLTAEETDVLSQGLEEPVVPGSTVRIDRVLTRTEEYSTTLSHETITCDDPKIPQGSWEVLIRGRDGELRCTAEVTYVNGQEVSRKVLSQTQTIAPVTEVVAWGTGPVVETEPIDPKGLPVIEDGYIRLPTGEVLTYTGTATVRASAYTHTDAGCDFITATGSRVHVGTVAVDPRYIPYGTRMFIMATSGSYVYGISEAEVCGGAIKGDRVDLYLPTYEACMEFGRRVCTVYYLG